MKTGSHLVFTRLRKLGIVPLGAFLLSATLFSGVAMRSEKANPPVKTSAGDKSLASQKVDFNRDILPIFKASCVSCHTADKALAKLRLDSEAAVFEGGVSGKIVIPGKSRESLLVKRLLGTTDAPRMPIGAGPLTTGQIALIGAWIDQGALASARGEVGVRPVASHAPAASESPLFATKIRPIFASRCYQCHGPDIQQNQLRLDSLASALKGGASGKVVVPGDSERSPLVRRLLGLDRPQMPYGGPSLSAAEVDLVRGWIDQGAPGPDSNETLVATAKPAKHWAFVKPVRPELPSVKNSAWCRNPIDSFVLAQLEKEGLSPSPEADRETLIRRLSLDLTGLPPTVQEVDAFFADKSPGAYENVVDRLLASPHFGERWARAWLDLARYADSHGYEKDDLRVAWKWRDWVINALNQDMSFKEFTVEQLAGDMLPNATVGQKIATGFHRNTMLNQEGGVDDEEYRYYTLVDRVNTTASVWLGLTLECAQCHNHKFDPFTQKEYYRFLAFFDNSEYYISNLGQGEGWVVEPEIQLPTPEQDAKSKELKTEIEKLKAVLSTQTPELDAAQAKWEVEMKSAAKDWMTLRPSHYSSAGGAKLTLVDDQSILAAGPNPDADTYTVEAKTDLSKITGVRLEVMNDPSLPHGGPGRDSEGNFVLIYFAVEAAPADKPDAAEKISFQEALANESQEGYGIHNLVKKGEWSTGWAVDTSPADTPLERQAVLVPEKPFGFEHGTLLKIRLTHAKMHASRNIGHFRLSVTSIPDSAAIAKLPARLRPVLDVAPAKRTPEQRTKLAESFRSVTPILQPTRDRIAELEKQLEKLGIVTAMVFQERAGFERPSTFLRIRGSYLSKGDKVYAGVPVILSPLPENMMPNRLGLASWLVDEENPLTARVEVNRQWESLFGHGLVETSENFGTQGARPTHPELLDWMATEFMREGWSVKKMLRLVVTSATYRQSSHATAELLERDPYNRLLARGPRFRVEGETVRDIALAVSGLLSPKIGGPSVFPYQPEGIWDRPYSDDKWVMSEGEERHRRAIYSFVRRTAPYPSLTTFDAPSREFCTVRRVRTNTPLQALTTLNDPVFFEAAQALAKRIAKEAGPDPAARVTYGLRLCVSRRPDQNEIGRLVAFHNQQLERFRKDPETARKVIGGVDKPSADVADLAAWTMVSNVLLNLDETITKE